MRRVEVEVDFGEQAFGWDPDRPDHEGFIVVEAGSPPVLVARIRPGMGQEARDVFAEWALQRFARFLEHGPEPDGWQNRSDGGWQLWCRSVVLPSLD